jgi:hypothetical protein
VVALLGAAVRYAAALFLLYAAAQKVVAPRSLRHTLTALRLPAAGVVAVVVPGLEITAAVGLVVAPHSVVVATLVAGLGLAFAGAGLVALRRGEPIRCACFGESDEATLGTRQLVALPVWLAVAAVGRYAPDWGTPGLPQVTAVGLVLAALVTARSLVPSALRNHAYLKVMESQARYQTPGDAVTLETP